MFDWEKETINTGEVEIDPFYEDLIEYLTGIRLSDTKDKEDIDKSIDIEPLDILPF